MVVGVGTVDLFIPEAHSLKEKRSVVRRVIQRVRNEFDISVAEVDSLDLHQKATIGFAVVSNDGRLANSILDRVVDFIERLYLAQITRADLDLLHV
ncbi:MAG: DUF503 domain-containing protein [Deltaproteobacteria bacterium]|nr:DUF503 domain-containing protein [Deltaproteobacteria bacterium]